MMWKLVLLAMAALGVAVVLVAELQAPPPKFVLKISRETTRINGPRLSDGTVDYAAALWQSMSAGVTVGNNAGIPLDMAYARWKEYTSGAAGAKLDEMYRQFDEALRHPWKPEQHPEMAAWLVENEEALAWVIQASGQTRLCPARPKAGEDLNAMNWHRGHLPSVGRALTVRAMQRVGTGDQVGARADVAAVRRLARLFKEEPDTAATLVAIALDQAALRVTLEAVRLAPPAESRKWLEECARFDDLRLNIAAIDKGARFSTLHEVMRFLRGQTGDALVQLTGLDFESMFLETTSESKIVPGDLDQVDWNVVLRQINRVYDRVVTICREEDRSRRREAWKRLAEVAEKEQIPRNFFDALGASLLDQKTGDWETHKGNLIAEVQEFLLRRSGETREAYSSRIGRYLAGGVMTLERWIELIEQQRVQRRVYTVAVALEVYRLDKGRYPENLDLLAPEYLLKIPRDLFSGEKLVYRAEGSGYIVYSVGPNGRDDGGRFERHEADDIAVQSAR